MSFLKHSVCNECKQNPARLRSELKALPNAADLKAKATCHQKTARNSELLKQSSNTYSSGPSAHTAQIHAQLLHAAVLSLPHSPAHLFQGHTRPSSRFPHATHSRMTQSATYPRPASSWHPRTRLRPYLHTHGHTSRAHVSVRTRAHTHTHPRPGSAQEDSGHTSRARPPRGGGAGRRGPAGAVTPDAEPRVLRAKSSRPPGFPQTPRPRPLPSRQAASAPLAAAAPPEPRNLNRDGRGGRGGSPF